MAEDPHRYYQWWKEQQKQHVPVGSDLWKVPKPSCHRCDKELDRLLWWCPKCWPHPEFCSDCFDEHQIHKHDIPVPGCVE